MIEECPMVKVVVFGEKVRSVDRDLPCVDYLVNQGERGVKGEIYLREIHVLNKGRKKDGLFIATCSTVFGEN